MIGFLILLGVVPALAALAVQRRVRTRARARTIAISGIILVATVLLARRALFWAPDTGFQGAPALGVYTFSLFAAFATGASVAGLLIAIFGPESALEERPLYPMVLVAASVVISMLVLMGLLGG